MPVFLAGCGPRMAEVHCKITFEGKPVTAGSVIFAPKAPDDQFEVGRPAVGAPDANGQFRLTTSRPGDGVLVGLHTVSYLAPGPPETVDRELFAKMKDRYEKFGRLRLPPGHTVEVKPGRNDITLELERMP